MSGGGWVRVCVGVWWKDEKRYDLCMVSVRLTHRSPVKPHSKPCRPWEKMWARHQLEIAHTATSEVTNTNEQINDADIFGK